MPLSGIQTTIAEALPCRRTLGAVAVLRATATVVGRVTGATVIRIIIIIVVTSRSKIYGQYYSYGRGTAARNMLAIMSLSLIGG